MCEFRTISLALKIYCKFHILKSLLISFIGTDETALSVDKFLLRELRIDLLPGRSYWTCEAPSASTASTDLFAIGRKSAPVANASGGGAAGSGGANSLKKLGLRGERGLVVELLKDSQVKVRPPAGAFRVWTQELLNPGAVEVSKRQIL